jgi:alkanesulfonate monooxygenase SsuD/methylene tetrahydromethanopterin reductase-like flavin-dependent oxidoreductase (luciferase family)
MKKAAFLPAGSVDSMIAWAKRIEAAGFDSLWHGELVNAAMIPLAAIAPALKRIRLGTAINLAFTHSPVMLAFAAMDMDLVSEGRFTLGLGVAHPNRNNNWYAGRDDGKPLGQLREYVALVRLIMEKAPGGGEILFDGKHYHVHARRFFPRMIAQPRARQPVYIAAVQRRMSALAGEVADGLIGNPLFSVRHLEDVVVPGLEAGLARSGRARADVELLGQCFTVVDDDLAQARRVAAGALLFSVWARIYDPIFEAHGFGQVLREVREIQKTGGRDPIDAIPPEMIDAFCAAGPADRVRAIVREREGLLDTVILTVPSTGTTREQQDHYRERILELFQR